MADETPVPSTPASSTELWMGRFWAAFDIVKALALVIVVSYVVLVALKMQPDETLKNMTLLVVGFYFGSSLGSKTKDAKPPEPKP